MAPGYTGRVRRAVGLLVGCGAAGFLFALLLAGVPAAIADTVTSTSTGTTTTTTPTTTTTTSTTSTTTTSTTTTTTVPKPPDVIAAGVRVGGILVGGLSSAEATDLVRARFRKPLTLVVSPTRRIRMTPQELGAAAHVGDAVKRARRARPGAIIPLKVDVPRRTFRRRVEALGRELHRDAVDSRLILRNLQPFATKAVAGRRLNEVAAERSIVLALKTHDRDPLVLPFEEVTPAVTPDNVGPVLIIRRGSNRLYYYTGMKLERIFNVATGQSAYPTPLGRFEIEVKWRDPWWYPPPSGWAKDKEPIPPGPGNPLGTRWMGLSAPYVGIHGTPDAASIGYSVSHGCIRMLIPQVEWLFEQVEIGTPVFIVSA
jgi:lipoprotein-anchoring transpeptidase ErfK/SrfK